MHRRSSRWAAGGLISIICVALGAWGGSLELTARDSITYARGYAAEVKKEHPDLDVSKVQAATVEVMSALTVYCNGTAYEAGGKCQKAKSGTVRKITGDNLKNRLSALADAIADLEAKH
jgi:hypothetical protein